MSIVPMLMRVALSLLVLAGFSMTAQANLIGQQVSVTNIFRGDVFEGPTDVTVIDPGIELIDFGGLWSIDIDAGSIGLTCTSVFCEGGTPGSPDEYLFEINWGSSPERIVAAVLDASAAGGFYGEPFLSFTENSVRFTIPGDDETANYAPQVGDRFVIDLDLRAVPEPSTLLLVATATLFLLGAARKHRRARAL